jgi:D-alanyl-lipoteichoic acid acyltransferase DltB (MBOAT superfamily)
MDPAPFATRDAQPASPALREWFAATGKNVAGFLLIFFVVPQIAFYSPLAAGWVGMIGATLALHFGTFHLIALGWQSAGIAAQPIMQKPAFSKSLSEFWGRRWNLGFRQLTHDLVFQPLRRPSSPRIALMASFLVSGLIHDLVISVPARAGYGWPTAYFALQGCGVLLERSRFGRRIGVHRGIRARLFALICVAAPLPWLFHAPFVSDVILPFLRALEAI